MTALVAWFLFAVLVASNTLWFAAWQRRPVAFDRVGPADSEVGARFGWMQGSDTDLAELIVGTCRAAVKATLTECREMGAIPSGPVEVAIERADTVEGERIFEARVRASAGSGVR